jgi:hypothetical protein
MGRRAGKTTVCSDLSGRNALKRHRGDNLWGAPTHAIAGIGREKLHAMYGAAICDRTTIPAVDTFYGGGKVWWKSLGIESGAIGRGYGLVVIDEAARIKSQRIYEDIFPTVADTGGKIVAITTPRGRKNWTFDWYLKAMAGDPLYAVVHGPSTENPSPLVQAYVDIARANMPDSLFRQEIMAEFVEGEGAVFRRIREAIQMQEFMEGPPSKDRRYIVGADLAKHQDFTVLYAMDMETRDVHGMDRFHLIDWGLQEDRIKAFARRWNDATVYVDSTGVGDAVYDHLREKGVPVFPVNFSEKNNKSNLVMMLAIAFETGEVGIVNDPIMIGELESYAYEITRTGKFSYSAPDGSHDDCVMALALAFYGVEHRLAPETWLDFGRKKREEAERSRIIVPSVGEVESGWRPATLQYRVPALQSLSLNSPREPVQR